MEFSNMGHRIRKTIPMYKALHQKEDIDRLYVTRKEGGKWTCLEDWKDAAIQRIKNIIIKKYINNSKKKGNYIS